MPVSVFFFVIVSVTVDAGVRFAYRRRPLICAAPVG